MISAFIGFLGVLVGAFVTAFKEWLFKRRDQRRNAEYLAIRVCAMLDHFVYACAGVVADDGTHFGALGDDGCRTPQVELVEIGFDELDVDWNSLPATLSYRVLTLPNEVLRDKAAIGRVANFDSPPDYVIVFGARQMAYALLGIKAAALSVDLRHFARLPEREELDWDPLDYLIARREQGN